MSSKDLPETLYVVIESDGDESYPVAYETLRRCGDMDESRTVGKYVLAETGTLTMEHSFAIER